MNWQRWTNRLAFFLVGVCEENCLPNRDTGFSDFVYRPDSKLLKTQRFGNCICFRPQVREDTYCVGSLRKSYPQSIVQWLRFDVFNGPNLVGVSKSLTWTPEQVSFRKLMFFRILDDGQSPRSLYSWFVLLYDCMNWDTSLNEKPTSCLRHNRIWPKLSKNVYDQRGIQNVE
jgi:hypothetical protein